jgi:hypothetical protein
MKKKLALGLPSLVALHSFTVFPEYFLSISIIYVRALFNYYIRKFHKEIGLNYFFYFIFCSKTFILELLLIFFASLSVASVKVS